MLALSAGQLVSWLGAIALLVILPRYLGDANLGKLTFSAALTALFGIVADLGSSMFLTREIARNPSSVRSLTLSVLVTRVPLGALSALLAIGFVWLAGYDEVTKQIVYVLGAATVVGSFANTYGAALQGLQRMHALTISQVTGRLLSSALVAALLLNGFGPIAVAAATLIGTAIGLSLSAFALRDDLRRPGTVSLATMRAALTGGLPFFVWQASLLVYGQIDFVLLSLLTRDAVVGWYSAAYRLILLPAFTPAIIQTAAFPALAALSRDPALFVPLARRAIHLIALSTIPMALGILMLSDKLVEVLRYPATFEHSVVPMMFLSLHVPLAGVDMVIGTVLGALDQQRRWALTGVAAAVLNPIGNLIAIPLTQHLYGNGAIGAAIVTTLTELFMMVVGVQLLPSGILTRRTVVYTARCGLAGLAMCAVILVIRELPVGLTILAGGAVYMLSSFVLRTLSVAELKLIVGQIAGRALASRAASA
jgi:O-antigen/teichoic acid export membrane protein